MDKIAQFCEEQNFCLADPFDIQIDEANWVKGYLVQDRASISEVRDILPEGLHAYAIRHSDDDDSVPSTLEMKVFVNRFGMFFTEEDLDWMFAYKDFVEIIDWGFLY